MAGIKWLILPWKPRRLTSSIDVAPGRIADFSDRRAAESAALLVNEVLPERPIRLRVLSFPFQLRYLFASRLEIMGRMLGIVYRVIATHLIKKAGLAHQTAKIGAVTLFRQNDEHSHQDACAKGQQAEPAMLFFCLWQEMRGAHVHQCAG